MKRTIILLMTIFLAVFIIQTGVLSAKENFDKGHRFQFMQQLTEEQRAAVKEKVKELRDAGTSREEIRKEVSTMLKEFGVELPDNFKGFPGHRALRNKNRLMRFTKELTEEQQENLKEKIEALREQGADRQEIRETIKETLKSYGVEVPDNFQNRHGERLGRGGFWNDLTDEQRDTLKEKIETLREQGADHQEIRETIKETLKSYGIEVSDNFQNRHGKRIGHGGFWKDLTEEQRTILKEKIKALKDENASHEEIHTAVRESLESFGIEMPPGFGDHRSKCENLTDDQRKAVRVKIREMCKKGASRDEIRQAVDKLLEEFGIKDSTYEDQADDILESSNDNLSVQSYPNPFNPETNIQYHLKSAAQVSLHIFDVKGQMICSLRNEYQQSGTYTIRWDGLNDNGKQVPSGIYFLRINAGGEIINHRLVMMK